MFDRAPFTAPSLHTPENARDFATLDERVPTEQLLELVRRVRALVDAQPANPTAASLQEIVSIIEKVVGELPFDPKLILEKRIENGADLETYVQVGQCPLRSMAGKEETGDTVGVDCSRLSQFLNRLERMVLEGIILG